MNYWLQPVKGNESKGKRVRVGNCWEVVIVMWAIPHTVLNVLITEKLCILVTLAQGGWYNYWSSSEETWWLSISTKSTSNQRRLTTSGQISTTRHNKNNWTERVCESTAPRWLIALLLFYRPQEEICHQVQR